MVRTAVFSTGRSGFSPYLADTSALPHRLVSPNNDKLKFLVLFALSLVDGGSEVQRPSDGIAI